MQAMMGTEEEDMDDGIPNSSIQGKVMDKLTESGIKECFEFFFKEVQMKIEEDDLMRNDVDEHMQEINDYIMLRLYSKTFLSTDETLEDYEQDLQIQKL